MPCRDRRVPAAISSNGRGLDAANLAADSIAPDLRLIDESPATPAEESPHAENPALPGRVGTACSATERSIGEQSTKP